MAGSCAAWNREPGQAWKGAAISEILCVPQVAQPPFIIIDILIL